MVVDVEQSQAHAAPARITLAAAGQPGRHQHAEQRTKPASTDAPSPSDHLPLPPILPDCPRHAWCKLDRCRTSPSPSRAQAGTRIAGGRRAVHNRDLLRPFDTDFVFIFNGIEASPCAGAGR